MRQFIVYKYHNCYSTLSTGHTHMEKNEKAALLRRVKTISELVDAMHDAQEFARRNPFTFPDMMLGDDAMGMQQQPSGVTFRPGTPGVWRGGC